MCDPQQSILSSFINAANGQGETLRQVFSRVAFDKMLFANAFLEIVRDKGHSTLSFYHQDASNCRVARDGEHILMHHDWSAFRINEAKVLPIYPLFEVQEDGSERSIIHYKDYEPMFRHYGVPQYIAGLGVSAIAYKTDRWNIARLDNSFQMSGVMMLDNTVQSEEEADKIVRAAEDKFGGKPGQVLFVLKEGSDDDNSRFIPITSSNDGDWESLHEQSNNDIVVAHSWFRSLSGLEYSSSFSAERIIYEYEIALNTLILAEQEELLEPIRDVMGASLGIDASSLEIINRPPTTTKPAYMRVWEARKIDGLEYNPESEQEQMLLSQI